MKVHIKTPSGNIRIEEWGVQKAKNHGLSSGTAHGYAISYFEQGKEQFRFMDKYLWEIHDDLIDYMSGTGNGEYKKLAKFLISCLGDLSELFKQYVAIEKELLNQTVGQQFAYQTALEELAELHSQCADLEGDLTLLTRTMQPEPATEVAFVVKLLALALHLFNSTLQNSILSTAVLINELQRMASGGDYSKRAYRKDMKRLQECIGERRQAGVRLNDAREQFYECYPNIG